VLDHGFAKADEVLHLMGEADVGILDDNLARAGQVRSNNRLIAVAGVAVENGKVLLGRLRLGRLLLRQSGGAARCVVDWGRCEAGLVTDGRGGQDGIAGEGQIIGDEAVVVGQVRCWS